MRTQVHRVTLLIVDHDRIGSEEVITVLENTTYPNRCIYPSVMDIQTVAVEWSDDHPLNKESTRDSHAKYLFESK